MNWALHERYGKRRRMMRWRWLAHYLADAQGWFWLPCPSCGESFAGFESASGSIVVGADGMKTTCSRPACVAIGAPEYRRMMTELRDVMGRAP
jgi:hypothetical protein